MATIPSKSYVLDSRLKNIGTTNNVATYNCSNAGNIEKGTYELLKFHTVNGVYNVDLTNNEIYWDEGAAELGPVIIPSGYYATPAALAAAAKIVMDIASGTTFTIVYVPLTNGFLFTPAAGNFKFNWGTNRTQPIAATQFGFRRIDGVLAASHASTLSANLDPHPGILVQLDQDSSNNVTLLDGTSYSFYIPLTVGYAEEVDSLRNNVFPQTCTFTGNFSLLTVRLFLDDGTVLPLENSSTYELVIRKLY